MKGFVVLAIFFTLLTLYLDIGYAIHDNDFDRIPLTLFLISVLSVMMYLVITDIRLTTAKTKER
jgi:hypothetical protein